MTHSLKDTPASPRRLTVAMTTTRKAHTKVILMMICILYHDLLISPLNDTDFVSSFFATTKNAVVNIFKYIYIYIYTHTHESESEVAQSCPTLWDPMDRSLPGSSFHVILQARILEWVAISFPKGSPRLRDQTWVSRIAGRCFNL